MDTTTSRRGLLKAAPAIALSATLPAPVAAAASPEWELVKRAYIDACIRFEAAVDADLQRDEEEVDFDRTAPTRELTYRVEGWSRQANGIKIEAAPKSEAIVLTRSNVDAVDAAVKATPEYAAFLEELGRWREDRAKEADARGWKAIRREWWEAADAQKDAWSAMVTFPVTSVIAIAEKVELTKQFDLLDEQSELLATSIAADARRISGREA